MKKLSLCVFLIAFSSFSADVLLSWTPNPQKEKIENYSIYKSQGNGKQSLFAIVSGTESNLLIRNLGVGTTHYFSIVANNSAGSSRPSNIKINIKDEKNAITNRGALNP